MTTTSTACRRRRTSSRGTASARRATTPCKGRAGKAKSARWVATPNAALPRAVQRVSAGGKRPEGKDAAGRRAEGQWSFSGRDAKVVVAAALGHTDVCMGAAACGRQHCAAVPCCYSMVQGGRQTQTARHPLYAVAGWGLDRQPDASHGKRCNPQGEQRHRGGMVFGVREWLWRKVNVADTLYKPSSAAAEHEALHTGCVWLRAV
jgi:hypothetical protein